MIVPFERLDEMMTIYDDGVPPPRPRRAPSGATSPTATCTRTSSRDRWRTSSRASEAILAFGREAIRLGGAPLAEHGVGRNAVKQQLLAELYGPHGIEEMRAIKRALDPEWKLAPACSSTTVTLALPPAVQTTRTRRHEGHEEGWFLFCSHADGSKVNASVLIDRCLIFVSSRAFVVRASGLRGSAVAAAVAWLASQVVAAVATDTSAPPRRSSPGRR